MRGYMLHRFLITLGLMLAFIIPAQAITIEELTSQPQFKQVSQFVSDIPNVDERGASYIDVNTVKVIGFEPPIYTIKATVYKAYQWNDEKVITVKDMTFTYDSSNSAASKIYRAQQQGSATSNTDVDTDATMNEDMWSNPGIMRDEEEISRFDFDGTPRPVNRGAFLRRPVVKDSLNKEFYDIADAVYYEVYKEHFDEVIVK